MRSNRSSIFALIGCGVLPLLSACFSDDTGRSAHGGADAGGSDVAISDSANLVESGSSGEAGADANTPVDAGGPLIDAGGPPIDAGGPLDAELDSGCDAMPPVPDLTSGAWLICNASDTAGRIWTGTLTITTETPSCGGADLAGTFDWVANTGQQGTTVARGTYAAATKKLTLDESQPTGGVVSGTDFMTYDPANDELVNGSWTCSCAPGMWSSARRVARDAGTTCAGDP